MRKQQRALVIGGAGMLGREIALQLQEQGSDVTIFDLEPVDINGIESHVGDIRDRDSVEKIVAGKDVVFQTAAAVWDVRLPESVYLEVNVDGNKNVIEACVSQGIPKLVYTSTLDVVVDGRKPITYGDESLPYPKKLPKDPYSRTKIIAEKMVLEANSAKLLTCALRPVGMYGPRDKYHLANIITMAKKGMRIRLGNGSARFSHVYSENAAHAHLLAAEHLVPGSKVCGNAYFVCDHQPASNLFDFMEPFLEALGLSAPDKKIPYWLAYILAGIVELLPVTANFNRFAVVQTCVDHTFVSDKAEADFGYTPIVSKEEAFARTLKWFQANST